MNKSQKIYFNSGNTDTKYVNIRLEQGVETLELMSMELSTKDAYQNFNADYGVLVGRVTANGGVGVENAKVSVFIPLMEEDSTNGDIKAYYSYTTPRDKNFQGKRYNLLPRVSKIDPTDGQVKPKQAFGSFPIKEEIVTNEVILNVYKKYYKYTTTTNIAGDYMIFGVPTGTQIIHMSVDITDIGRYSMNPAAMVTNLGYPESAFTNNNTKIKESTDLTDLPHIETQDITVEIIPFWGDTENFEIGITRQDFRIRAELANQFIIFGSSFTDNPISMRGSTDDSSPGTREIRDYFNTVPNVETESADNNQFSSALANKRVSEITEKIYYYPAEIDDNVIDNQYADSTDEMLVLDKSQYSIYKKNGDFIFIINCNRKKVVTNDYGDEVVVSNDSPEGVFTEFRGFITLEYTLEDAPMTNESYVDRGSKEATKTLPLRLRFKFPQHAEANNSFDYTDSDTATAWRKQHMKFTGQKFYTISTFLAAIANNENTDDDQFGLVNYFFKGDEINDAKRDAKFNIGPIQVGNNSGYLNDNYEMEANADINGVPRFGANWLNFCVYFPQIGYTVNPIGRIRGVRVADFLATQWENRNDRNVFFIFDNAMPIAGGNINTKWFGRSDLHWTDIIEVPLNDIKIFRTKNRGFTYTQNSLGTITGLSGKYRSGIYTPSEGGWSTPCPFNGGKIDGDPTNLSDTKVYFYKGFGTSNGGADCIEYLFELGLIT